jgi:hypothetical protein
MGSGADNGGRHADGLVLAGYCVVCGLVASVVGAASSLLANGTRDKLIVWGLVAVTVALAGGTWWGYSPDAVRRVVSLSLHRPGRHGAHGQTGPERRRPR